MRYKIAVIDDEYNDREETYKFFLEKEFETIPNSFEVLGCSDLESIQNLFENNEQIDAVFLDARLGDEDQSKKWGNYTFDYILKELETRFNNQQMIPLFMVSKRWSEQPELLTRVSKSCIDLDSILQPSMFYSYQYIENICQEAKLIDIETNKPKITKLKSERENVYKEIGKYSLAKDNSISPIDVVIICAIPDEKHSAYAVFDIKSEADKEHSKYNIKYQETVVENIHVAFVQQLTMGMTEAARVTTASIMAFKPKLIIMVGICAGEEHKTKIGDIIIPTKVFDYASGKIKREKLESDSIDRFISRSQVVEKDKRLEMLFNRLEDPEIAADMSTKICSHYRVLAPVPEDDKNKAIKVSSMASGPWVVDSPTVFNMIQNFVNDKCPSLDMEAYAVAKTSEIYDIPWLIVKTVQDYANGEKTVDEQSARKYAAYASASFVKNNIKMIMDIVNEHCLNTQQNVQ